MSGQRKTLWQETMDEIAKLRAERDALKARAERAETAIYKINTWSNSSSVKAGPLNWSEFNNLVGPFIK